MVVRPRYTDPYTTVGLGDVQYLQQSQDYSASSRWHPSNFSCSWVSSPPLLDSSKLVQTRTNCSPRYALATRRSSHVPLLVANATRHSSLTGFFATRPSSDHCTCNSCLTRHSCPYRPVVNFDTVKRGSMLARTNIFNSKGSAKVLDNYYDVI